MKGTKEGSVPGKSANRRRDYEGRWKRFYELYFAPSPVYSDEQFRRRFRMRKELFHRLCERIMDHDSYFTQKRDCTGKLGINPIMKITGALRVLAYGSSADALDENLEISASVVRESTERFTKAVIEIFGDHYLRAPTEDDIRNLLRENARRGFPGMVGSIDCMKWEWKNCPSGWRGAFQGKDGKATVVMEAIASYDLHIWHAFIGMPGASNDLNVLDASPVVAEYLDDDAPQFTYEINGAQYNFVYWLADGIYPEWKCFVRTISSPISDVEVYFAEAQEALRKDVERAFGVLQARFAIVARPALFWSIAKLTEVMRCCVILHNMIIEDDKNTGRVPSYSRFQCTHGRGGEEAHTARFSPTSPSNHDERVGMCFMEKFSDLQDHQQHRALRQDLMQHLWDNQSRLRFRD